MRWKLALVVMWSSLLCGSCASHAGQQGSGLPAVLHGVWRSNVDSCKADEEVDGDGWVDIRASDVHGYERNSRVLSVASISDTPQAWKVRLRHDDQGDISDGDAIFVVTSQDQGRLVVIDASTYQAYIRCD